MMDNTFMDMLVRGSMVIRETVTDKELLQEVKSDIVLLTELRNKVLRKKLHTQLTELMKNAEKCGVINEMGATRINLDFLLGSDKC